MRLTLALFFATTLFVAAQGPQVPHKMKFADMTLTIRDDARREIQKDVDALTRYAKAFEVKVQRARTYFPIIEQIFAEENVPDDFKYLVIQESALIADAVSVSNAVGFWQFKDFTAIEMGLRVDKTVDERMNIVSSSRAAARYLKKNNTFFDNWLYALQAYQMGAGGVMRSEKDTKAGVKHMDITSKTYWYVKKYLAHKIAYEGSIKGQGEIKIVTFHTRSKKSLAEIAREVQADEEEIKTYNKWLKASSIPDDRSYAVAIPVKGDADPIRIPAAGMPAAVADASKGLRDTATPKGSIRKNEDRIRINGITAIRALENETPTQLAARAGVDLSDFLKWNDMSISDPTNGKYFFLGKKRNRASTAYHKVAAGETLWLISQKYGVQMKRLRKYNRMSAGDQPQPGTTLWLASMKPKSERNAPPVREVLVEVDQEETFNWTAATPEKNEAEPQELPVETPNTANAADTVLMVTEEIPEATDEPIKSSADTTLLTVEVPETSADTVHVKEPVVAEARIEVEPQPDKVVLEHVVQPKETLYGIAREYKIAVMDIVNWNKLDLTQGIRPGQVLKVREPEGFVSDEGDEPQKVREHIVQPSDTVYSIARKYGVTIKELMEWNKKKDFNLSVGEKLTIHPR